MYPFLIAVALLYHNAIHASAAIVIAENREAALTKAAQFIHPEYKIIDIQIGTVPEDALEFFTAKGITKNELNYQ